MLASTHTHSQRVLPYKFRAYNVRGWKAHANVSFADIWPKGMARRGTADGAFIQQVPAWSADEAAYTPEASQAATVHRKLPPPVLISSGSLVSWAQG